GYAGTALTEHSNVKTVNCPFTGEELAAVPALRPDVAIVHAQEADHDGNVQLWGIPGVQKEAVLASKHSVVTVERIVDELEPRGGWSRCEAFSSGWGVRAPRQSSRAWSTTRRSCWSTSPARSGRSRRGSRCRSAMASWPRPRTPLSRWPRCSTTGSSRGGSTW